MALVVALCVIYAVFCFNRVVVLSVNMFVEIVILLNLPYLAYLAKTSKWVRHPTGFKVLLEGLSPTSTFIAKRIHSIPVYRVCSNRPIRFQHCLRLLYTDYDCYGITQHSGRMAVLALGDQSLLKDTVQHACSIELHSL